MIYYMSENAEWCVSPTEAGWAPNGDYCEHRHLSRQAAIRCAKRRSALFVTRIYDDGIETIEVVGQEEIPS